jgi:hypothetical protein
MCSTAKPSLGIKQQEHETDKPLYLLQNLNIWGALPPLVHITSVFKQRDTFAFSYSIVITCNFGFKI